MKLIPGKQIGDISFDMNKEQIEEILGAANEINVLDEADLIELDYIEKELVVYLEKDGNNDVFYSIHLDQVILEDKPLMSGETTELDAIKIIEQFHKTLGLNYEIEQETEDGDTMLFFPNINLAIWVDKGMVNDLCVEKPEDADWRMN